MYSPGLGSRIQYYPMPNKKSKKQNKTQKKKVQQQVVYRDRPQRAPKNSFLGDLGSMAGNAVSKIFGLGAYEMNQNTVYEDMIKTQVPVMHSSSESIVLRHREFITNIRTSAAFEISEFIINPGLVTTFPYLANIAQNFQEYEFRGLVFEYKSTSTMAITSSTNTSMGAIMMAAQYRADATSFVNKQQLLNEMWSADARPSDNFMLPIECKPDENPLRMQYVRGGPVPSGQDAKLYDLAKLTVASAGSQNENTVGELWATYEVVLKKPQLSAGLALYGKTYYASLSSVGTGNTFAGATPLFDGIGIQLSLTGIRFPPGVQGNWLINYFVAGTPNSIQQFASITYSNCSEGWISQYSPIQYSPSNGTSSGSMQFLLPLTITYDVSGGSIAAQVILDAFTPPTGNTGYLIITQVAYGA